MDNHSKTAAENRRILAVLLVSIGVLVLVGPAATYLWLGHSQQAPESALMFWHLFSAFGIVIYGPIGLAFMAIGWVVWHKSRKVGKSAE